MNEVAEYYSEVPKKLTFLNGIVDESYSVLHDILMEDDSKTYQDCILALRKKGVDNEESKRSHRPLRRIAANHLTEKNPGLDVQAGHDIRYLPMEL